MLSPRTRLFVVVLAGSLLGCAPAGGDKRVTDLRARVAELQQQLQQSKRRSEDLNNQVFLLQDRVDSQRVAASRARSRPRAKPRPATTPARPVARRPTAPRDSAADIARRRARRRLPVVRLRRGRTVRRARQARHASRARHRRRTRRLARKPPAGRGKRIVLRLTGAPSAPRTSGKPRKPLGPVPRVSHRLPVVPLPAVGTGAPPASTGRPVAEYRAARALFLRKKYGEAARAFSRFARLHPRHSHADNAQYWLAECFYRRGKVAKAAWVLRKLLKRYPSGNKAPSALLKLALCERRLGRRAKSRKILAQVVQLYPGTREAAVATSHLRRRR